MRSIDKITLEEHFSSLFDIYTKDFSPKKIEQIISLNNYTKCYKLMYGIPVGINAKKILELGIGSNGLSTYLFLEALKVTDGYLISIENNISCDYDKFPDYDQTRWTIILGDSATVATPEIDRGGFDIIMIDTSHERDQTKKELEKYVPLLNRGGYLYMHDTNQDSVLIPLTLYVLNNPGLLDVFYMEDNVPQMTILRKI